MGKKKKRKNKNLGNGSSSNNSGFLWRAPDVQQTFELIESMHPNETSEQRSDRRGQIYKQLRDQLEKNLNDQGKAPEIKDFEIIHELEAEVHPGEVFYHIDSSGAAYITIDGRLASTNELVLISHLNFLNNCELIEKNANLEERLSKLNETIEEREKLKNLNNGLNARNKALNERIAILEKQLEEINEEKKQRTRELKELSGSEFERNNESNALKEQIEELLKKFNDLKEENKTLKQDLKEKEDHNKQLSEQVVQQNSFISKLKEWLGNKADTIFNIANVMNTQERDNYELKKQNEKKDSENKNLKEQKEKTDSENKKLKEQNEKKDSKIDELNKQNNEMAAEIEELKDLKTKFQESNDILAKKINEIREMRQGKQESHLTKKELSSNEIKPGDITILPRPEEINTLRQKEQDLKNYIKELEKKLRLLKDDNGIQWENKEKEYKSLEDDLNKRINEQNGLIASLFNRINALQNYNSSLYGHMLGNSLAANNLVSILRCLEQENAELKDELLTTKNEVANLNLTVKNKDNMIISQGDTIKNLNQNTRNIGVVYNGKNEDYEKVFKKISTQTLKKTPSNASLDSVASVASVITL